MKKNDIRNKLMLGLTVIEILQYLVTIVFNQSIREHFANLVSRSMFIQFDQNGGMILSEPFHFLLIVLIIVPLLLQVTFIWFSYDSCNRLAKSKVNEEQICKINQILDYYVKAYLVVYILAQIGFTIFLVSL